MGSEMCIRDSCSTTPVVGTSWYLPTVQYLPYRTVGRYLRYGTSIPTVSYYVGKKMLSQVKSRVTSFLFQLILNRLLGRVLKKKLQEIDVHDGIVTCNNVALDEKAVGALLLQ